MRKILLTSVAVALLPTALPARAGTPNPAGGQAASISGPASSRDAAAADPNRRICVSERLSGSRMPRRVCRTAREWQLLQADDSDDR